jgi:CheY-like chemotaxis protein
VVDDNHDAAESLAMLLKLLSADVQVVYSGADVLEALATYKPSVVLLDIGMPGMDGLEVARRIRQLPESKDVTLIALTGWGQEEDRKRSESAGFDYHLTKPADLNALRNLLTSLDRPEGAVRGVAEPRPLQGRRKSGDPSDAGRDRAPNGG